MFKLQATDGKLRNVYLGICLQNQGNLDESESAYREAISAEGVERQRKPKAESPIAWQGLVKLYEAQRKVDEYMDSALKLASIYRDMYISSYSWKIWESGS